MSAPAPHAPAAAPPIVLHQFTPALELQALCRFTGTPFLLNNSRFPHAVSTGYLPQLQHGSVLAGGDVAAQYLVERVCGGALEAHLTPLQAAHAAGLLALVRGTLAHVERWCHYGEDGGFVRNRAALAAHAHAPLGWLLARGLKLQCVGGRPAAARRFPPRSRNQHAHTRAFARSHQEQLMHSRMRGEEWVRSRAMAAYGALGEALAAGGGPFFFGKAPAALDAAVFGHLHAVRGHAAAAWVPPPLVDFYGRVQAAFFAEPPALLGGSAPACALQPGEDAQLGAGRDAAAAAAAAARRGPTDAELATNVVASVAIFAAVVIIGQALVRGQR